MKLSKSIFSLIICAAFAVNANAQKAWGVLASPFQLQIDTSTLLISDYFPYQTKIDSVKLQKGIELVKLTERELVVSGRMQTKVSAIKFFTADDHYDIPCFAPDKYNVDINIQLDKPASELKIKGTFSSWAPISGDAEGFGVLADKI